MSLSVSSFPEAPPNLVRQSKWQVTPSLKSSGRFLGTLISKRSLPSLKGIGQFAKTYVKGGITRQRANVSRSRWLSKHHSPLNRSSILSSNIVIDITPISINDKYTSAGSSDVDASSLDPTIEFSPSPAISPAALSFPTAAKDFPAISHTNSVNAPYQSSVQSLVSDSAHAHETVVQHPANGHEEATPADSESHDLQPPNSEITTPLPISPSLKKTQLPAVLPVPSTEGRRRSNSASAGVKAPATKTVPPTRPRYKSETAIGLPRLTTITPSEPIPQPPAATGSAHTSESTSTKKQRQQRRETIFERVRARSAGASSKNAGSNKDTESLPSLRARLFSMRSLGSRLSVNSHHRPRKAPPPPLQLFSSNSATALVPIPKSSPEQMDLLAQPPPHLRPNTSDVAASPPRSRSPPSPVVGPGPPDDDSKQLPLPESVNRGLWLRLAAVPHAESWDGDQQRRRPRTAPEAVLMASW